MATSKGSKKAKSTGKDSSVLRDTKPKAKSKAKSKAKPRTTPAPKAKKKISVSLVQFGTGETPVELLEGATVSDLLVEAGLSSKDGSVLINSQPAGLDDKVPAGATVVFATKIKGGCL
jgi:sulfur carrier protein ThiS